MFFFYEVNDGMRWNSLIKATWIYIKTLEINPEFQKYSKFNKENDKITEFIIKVLKRSGKYLTQISISYSSHSQVMFKSVIDYKQVMENVQKYCTNLNSLFLTDDKYDRKVFTEEQVQSIFYKNEKLKNISLKNLNLNATCFSSIKNPSIIETLKLVYLKFETEKPVLDFMTNLHNLKIFHFENNSMHDELALKCLHDINCNSLIDIILPSYNASCISKKLFSKQRKLRKIQLGSRNRKDFTYTVDEEFVNNLSGDLEELLGVQFLKIKPERKPFPLIDLKI